MDKAASYLGLARKAGMLALGEQQCIDALQKGRAKLFLLAADAAENTVSYAHSLSGGHRAPLMSLPWSKDELSAMLGRAGCAMLIFTDLPFAAQFAAALAETIPEWRSTAALLEARRNKAQRRKAAPRKHDAGGRRRT